LTQTIALLHNKCAATTCAQCYSIRSSSSSRTPSTKCNHLYTTTHTICCKQHKQFEALPWKYHTQSSGLTEKRPNITTWQWVTLHKASSLQTVCRHIKIHVNQTL